MEGIGAKRAQNLYIRFRTLKAMEAASVEQLEETPGMTHLTALNLYRYLHGEKEGKEAAEQEEQELRLNCINLVSTEPERLRSFYAMILQKPYNEIVPGRSEILVGEVKLVFTRTSVQTPVNPDSCGLRFAVEDVTRSTGG